MAHSKRLCRLERRANGQSGRDNYYSPRAHAKGRRRRALHKAGRRAARRRSK